MGNLLDLAFYNPTQLKDDDFLRGFVARQELVAKILARLGEITPKNLAKHRLIVGQRGMGKTSLLRRIAIGVRDTPTLAEVLLPLRFREEQYNVHNLHVFWCNCLDALGDWYEASGKSGLADQLDREVAALTGSADDSEGNGALTVFKEWLNRENKRPLLMLDNIDLIFTGLKDKQWSLRRTLQEAGGIVVIGASAGFLEATSAPDAPFYDFFQVDVLEKLGRDELLASLRQLAEARGEAGRKVTALLANDPGRIHTIYDLTGGNPRTLVMLYLMLEASDGGDLMRDLERLLDQVTPLYKARVEDLSAQARVVFDAVALAWNPATAADTSAASGLETATVSTQLDRLQKDGILEKVELSTTSRAGFQVTERFFNIWYLMRHASRSQRNRLRWLTEFLRKFYSPQELGEMAGTIIRNGDLQTRSAYCLALSEAVDDPDLQRLLRFEAGPEMTPQVAEASTPQTAQEWHKHGQALQFKLGAYDRAMDAFRKAIELDPSYAYSWNSMGFLLASRFDRFNEAEAAYNKAINLNPTNSHFRTCLGNLLQNMGRYDEAEIAYRHAIKLNPNYAYSQTCLANLLCNHLVRYDEAEDILRRAIKIDPKDPYSLTCLGNLLREHFGRFEEAEAIYRKAIELDHKYTYASNCLGILLQNHLGRYEEAEITFRQAIARDPKSVYTWNNLGHLLQHQLGRYEEAEAAYRKAIELNPKYAFAWNGLGNLMQDHLGRSAEAETAYRQAIELFPDGAFAFANLAYLLLSQTDRTEEAETCYLEAIAKLPARGAALLQAFRTLTQDNFGQAVELLQGVLIEGHQDIFTKYRDDLLRILRLTAKKNYGDKLLAWLGESGLGDRYWPFYVAFDAYLHGKERLGDFNPEVRGAASRIYDWLVSFTPAVGTGTQTVKKQKKRKK